MDKAKELRFTQFECVSIVPDLTKSQRRDEQALREEADRKNGQLTAEDREKNLKWIVVGKRGEKRLIKGVEREQPTRNRDEQRTGLPGNRNQALSDWIPRVTQPQGTGPTRGTIISQQLNINQGDRDRQERTQAQPQEVAHTDSYQVRRDSWPALGAATNMPSAVQRGIVQEPRETGAVRRPYPINRDGTDGQETGRQRINSKRGRDGDEWEEGSQPYRRYRQ